MNVDGKPYHSIWREDISGHVKIIDQRWLPHEFRVVTLSNCEEAAVAIAEMWVRGAPLIGATAGYGIALQMAEDASDEALQRACSRLMDTRPTAINLRWAVDRVQQALSAMPADERAEQAWQMAADICNLDIESNRAIGEHGLAVIRQIAASRKDGQPVNILTHCNAGWLATVDWGTATSPMFHASEAGVPIHVYVSETRPRNQGAQLTAWELDGHGVPHHLIVDNAGGHLMQHGQIDMVLVGVDRATATGDVCNKIGTYLKALAARDNQIPFYAALPSSTIDWTVNDGLKEIPIEERDQTEVTEVFGQDPSGTSQRVRISPANTPAANPAFDVTPAHLVTGLITERGVCEATPEALAAMFPEMAASAKGRQ